MFDPIKLSEEVEKVVCRDGKRKYFRFRWTRFYGGSATADVVGCNLRCVYCWSWKYVTNPSRYGRFYSPSEVAAVLNHYVEERGGIARITGGEPTLCFDHLLELLEMIEGPFVLETNGILLDKEKVRELSKFDNLFVRVSLKGVDEETFQRITGAEGRFFQRQLETLKLLAIHAVPARPAILYNLFSREQLLKIQKKLLEMSPRYVLELEPFLDYGGAEERLKKAGLEVKRW